MAKEKKFITCDGNAAAAHIAYMFSEVGEGFSKLQTAYRHLMEVSIKGEMVGGALQRDRKSVV